MTPERQATSAASRAHSGGEEREPAWAPDGKWIALVRRQPSFTTREIWRMRPDGAIFERVTRLDAASYGPAWSPDGKRIVFSSNANDEPVPDLRDRRRTAKA